ncbi:uncharacterized protein [Eurosta solidaginis]|uniref:uncharacterized protein isoform X2 n=1 Tax=Eurosta solidaginis TaxID=178769 RepID=UPI0035317C12
MLAQSYILFLIASTAICISNTINDAYDAANDVNNKNIYYAARQRLSQQQQLQRKQHDDQQGFETINYDGNFRATKSYNSNDNNNDNDNNPKYKKYFQQQNLQNSLVRVEDDKSKAIAKHKSVLNLQRPQQEYRTSEVHSKIHSDLTEIFAGFQEGKRSFDDGVCDKCGKAELRNPSKDFEPTQEHNAENPNQVNLIRRSPPSILHGISAASKDAEELDMDLPYGIQNVRKRHSRHGLDFTRSIIYQSLCPTKRTSIPLETSRYEYRPNQYIEVTCAHQKNSNTYDLSPNRVCSEAGFSCIQLNRTIHLIRRNKLAISECWELEIRIVPSGCECMWPKHDHGDITVYHRLQKRFGGYANEQANSDYEEGEGYRQIRPQQNEPYDVNGLTRNENADGVGFEVFEYPN